MVHTIHDQLIQQGLLVNGLLDHSVRVDEETLSGYKEEQYYPANIGEVFHDRYKVIGKLGYGTASTVWLCRDLQTEGQFVAVKVYINSSKERRELPIYNHINSLDSDHNGRHYIRKLLAFFEISGPHGTHTCLVHKALGMNMEEVRGLFKDDVLPAVFARDCMRNLLFAMHFLHEDARVIHTDIQPKNILMGVLDKSAFEKYERAEREDPMPRKELTDRTVYCSRPMPFTEGLPSLSDLSEARFDDPPNVAFVMPNVYRAPEVVLDMPWSYPIDLWAFAMTLWDLFEPKHLFNPHTGDGVYSEEHHLAQMISIMGPPPPDFLQRSERSKRFWDDTGNWIGGVPIPQSSLEDMEMRLQGEERVQFLRFMRKMLQWAPEQRESLSDVFTDDWLQIRAADCEEAEQT